MGNSRQGQIPSELGWLVDMLGKMEERLSTVESPTGEALSSTVAKLTALVADIQAQLDAWAAGRWTNAQIVTQINNLIATAFGSNVAFGGTLTSVTTFNTDIGGLAGSRRAMWMHDSGLFGWASSSRDRKTEIEPANIDAAALLSIEPKTFRYLAAIKNYDELPDDEKPGREPLPEVGLIAQDLDEAGLGHFVDYGPDGAIEGINYTMLVVALLAVDRAQQAELVEVRERLARLERAVGLEWMP